MVKFKGELPVGRSGADAFAIAMKAARQAGELLLHSTIGEVAVKGKADVVTDVDKASELCLRSVIGKEFPTHSIVGEEYGGNPGGQPRSYRWVIDPLDGTLNFSRGIPVFAVTLALVLDDLPLLGVVYDPIRKECFGAQRRMGATLNGRPIHVRGTMSLDSALVGYDLGYIGKKARRTLAAAHSHWGSIQTFRSLGSCALSLAYVAAGRLDGYYHPSAWIWDFMAGWLLVKEARGAVSTDEGESLVGMTRCSVVAAPPLLHPQLLYMFSGQSGS